MNCIMNMIDLAVKNWINEKAIAQMMEQITEKVVKKDIMETVGASCFKFSKDYYEYLVRSMQSLKFNTGRIEEFQKEWSGYSKPVHEFLNTREIPIMLKLRGNIYSSFSFLDSVENQIKERFVEDWGKHLTPADKGIYSEFAFLVQILQESDFCNPGRGQAISCSLFTKEFQKLYQDRNLGYVYNLKNRDLILVSTSDAHSHFVPPESFCGENYSGNVFGSALGFAHVMGEAFWSFDDFVSKCKPDEMSEIIFHRTSWEGQLSSGVFIREGVSERGQRLAYLASELQGIPIYYYKNGTLQIV